jgi:hypothetical protein
MFAEAIDDLLGYIGNMADQTVSNPAGTVAAPSAPAMLNSVAAGGIANHQIQDSSPVARGVVYHIESSPTQTFTSPTLVYSGPSRNFSHFIGNTSLYFRAFSQYPTSAPSAPVYFGGASSPKPVSGGGAIVGPVPQPSAGSGTSPTSGNTSRPEGFGFAPSRGIPATSNLSNNPRLVNPLNPFNQ